VEWGKIGQKQTKRVKAGGALGRMKIKTRQKTLGSRASWDRGGEFVMGRRTIHRQEKKGGGKNWVENRDCGGGKGAKITIIRHTGSVRVKQVM